jgi:hypothetical protein
MDPNVFFLFISTATFTRVYFQHVISSSKPKRKSGCSDVGTHRDYILMVSGKVKEFSFLHDPVTFEDSSSFFGLRQGGVKIGFSQLVGGWGVRGGMDGGVGVEARRRKGDRKILQLAKRSEKKTATLALFPFPTPLNSLSSSIAPLLLAFSLSLLAEEGRGQGRAKRNR